MSIAQGHAPLVSPEDYLLGEEGAPQKHEYLNGVVYAMAGGLVQHSRISTNILIGLGKRLVGRRCQPFNSDVLIRVQRGEDLRFYYPDVSVICDPNAPDERFHDHPVVVFEVLSESTARTDRGEKREAYFSISSLRVFALVEVETRAVTMWRRGKKGWTAEYFTEADAVLRLQEIECELPLAEIYSATGIEH